MLLQKSKHFLYTPYVAECCDIVAAQGDHLSDKHLPYIVQLQKLTEDLELVVSKTHAEDTSEQFVPQIQSLKSSCDKVRSSIPFPLSESRKSRTTMSGPITDSSNSPNIYATQPFGLAA